MKNAMQLKAIMKNLAKEKNLSAQILLQNYMLERLLERVSLSKFRDSLILKGGFLIAAMVGLDTRSTMDMDVTVKGYPVTEQTTREMFEEICRIEIPDDIAFEFQSIGEIREGDDYDGFRVALTANYAPMAVPLKLDVTTGDAITPKEICFDFPMMFEDRYISVLAYNPETILAEKLETVLSRADQNTRPRDYYDIYILHKLWQEKFDMTKLKAALDATAQKRGSTDILCHYDTIMQTVVNSEVMYRHWESYQKNFAYAKGIAFDDTCQCVIEIMNEIK